MRYPLKKFSKSGKRVVEARIPLLQPPLQEQATVCAHLTASPSDHQKLL
jgi:hypothetical protein